MALIKWAQEEYDVRAIGIVGSHARGTANQNSDIDLIIVSDVPTNLTSDLHWIGRFGEVKSVASEDYDLVQSARVIYQFGCEVEFGITGREWCSIPIDKQTALVIKDGMLILYDPDEYLCCAQSWVAANG